MELRFTIILGAAYAVNTWTIGLFCFKNRLFRAFLASWVVFALKAGILDAEGAEITQKTQKKTQKKTK
jgi:hypothetical protein